MDGLMKYVPFVDFLLKIDREKYYKFANIRKWILSKKTYPLNVMNKIEEAVLTQYKNILLENKVQIPKNITDTFAPSINLCSDDEDEDVDSQNKKENRVNNSAPITKKSKPFIAKKDNIKSKLDYGDDDDLEIVSINYTYKAEKKIETQPLKESKSKEECDMDEMFNKIDQLTADDVELKSSRKEQQVNHTIDMKKEIIDTSLSDQDIFQRRNYSTDMLFKRRTDFTDDAVVEEKISDKNEPLNNTTNQMVTISLDSDSETEFGNDGERPSTSHSTMLNSINVTEKTNLENPAASKVQNTDSDINSRDKNDNLELLYRSLDDVIPEVSDIINEVEETNIISTKQLIDKLPLVTKNYRERITENNANTNNKNPVPGEVSKFLDYISSKSENIFEVLQQINTEQRVIPETPPPAPPPLIADTTNIMTPVQPYYEQYQQQIQQSQMAAPIMTYNIPEPTIPPPLKPKLNVNDPRIKKQLQLLTNSPIFSYNILNNDLEQSIRQICHDTVMQPSILNLNQNNPNPTVAKNSTPGAHKSAITYGEYKRRQQERHLEMERKREDERKAKIKTQLESEGRAKQEDPRSKILSILSPCKDRICSSYKPQSNDLGKQNNNIQNLNINSTNNHLNNKTSEKQQKENELSKDVHNTNELNTNPNTAAKNNQSKNKGIKRVFSTLRCTVKGFDQIQDYVVQESKINSNENSVNSSPSKEDEETAPRHIGLRRRSSMHALSAISEQLGMQSDNSDSDLSQHRPKSRSFNSSSENLSEDSLFPMSKRSKRSDEVIKPNRRVKTIIYDESSSSDDEKGKRKAYPTLLTKVPVLKLHRMSNEFIRKHTKCARKESLENSTNKLDQRIKLKKTNEIVENLQEPIQKPKLKKYNNDCRMIERNTSFCVLCRSKPGDLTNHYKARHKTESYISRLDWSDIEDLAINTHFAILLPHTKNYRFERYEVECPFCKDKITDQFINFYNHYSAHTGEYAFQCSHCGLAKPYKPDIQSHILHSKTCRNSTIQVVYRYPPQAQCIYLHYCDICNFVQLNEANVYKHLREHHDSSKAIANNVQKCILAAISDAPDAYQTKQSSSFLPTNENCNASELNVNTKPAEITITATTSQIQFKVDDDDIPVSNEPCLEDDDDGKYSHEDMLKYLHEEPAKTTETPITVIHNLGPNTQQTTAQLNSPQNAAIQIHKPIVIKTEATENNEEMQPALKKSYMVYEKYRSYPPNVNYLGLFKCMIDDCYYSSDCSQEMLTHLTEHSTDTSRPYQYLQCPYCILALDRPITPTQLIDHVCTHHGHLNFQCSMCCYRSCDASNVHLHQQIHHNADIKTCGIYKLSITDLNQSSIENINLNEKIEKNVFKISCIQCKNSTSFYHTQLLVKHLYNEHNITSNKSLHIYSCIYCPCTVDNRNQLRIHIAVKHPGERPLIYDHNSQINTIDEDIKHCSNVIDISEPVPYTDTTAVPNTEETISQDLKPDFEQLLLMNEETAKVRLRKLTAHTGVAPDNLYRCPELTCSGFFSNFELWLRHMKARHYTLECQCPHCPTTLCLQQFAIHFEQHRRHTYICFYCSTTCPTEILARKHLAQKHSEFRQMRFEEISCNISYKYSIMIQGELFEERQQFIAEFLNILDKRLKELEINEFKNLKQQWSVLDNMPWLDDYLQSLPKRKVARRCLVKDCQFRTLKEENLYNHLSTSHTITGTQFNCSKCDYRIEKCINLDELFDHIKLHNEYHFMCIACALVTSSRSKMSAHILQQHTARDVPVIHLFRTKEQRYHKIYIVFADDHITFSTMKNCFCCSEQNMSGDVFSLHLKRYHNLTLSYCCEKCINFSFKSLQEVKPHFEQFHNSEKFKIRCELAGRCDLHVLSHDPFQVLVATTPLSVPQQISSLVTVKDEPMDASDNDNVVLIEDDDILIEHSVKAAQQRQMDLPKLKCASFSKLTEPNTENTTAAPIIQTQQAKKPSLKCVDFSKMIHPNTILPSATTLVQSNITPILPPVASGTSQVYYNLDQQNFNRSQLLNNHNSLNQIPAAAPVPSNNTYYILNRTLIRPVISNSTSTSVTLNSNSGTSTQVRSCSFNVNAQNNLNTNTQNLTNNVYINRTTGHIYQPNNEQTSNFVNVTYSAPQNYKK